MSCACSTCNHFHYSRALNYNQFWSLPSFLLLRKHPSSGIPHHCTACLTNTRAWLDRQFLYRPGRWLCANYTTAPSPSRRPAHRAPGACRVPPRRVESHRSRLERRERVGFPRGGGGPVSVSRPIGPVRVGTASGEQPTWRGAHPTVWLETPSTGADTLAFSLR